MTLLRRVATAALVVAFLHIVFGAIVRISGSGMGCGVHWPKCYGYWFPPFSRPDLVIEVLHRYFAATVSAIMVALAALAYARRREPGVAGPGGVLNGTLLALALVCVAAGFGALTVKFRNAPWATAGHELIGASLLAALVATVVRAGGFGAARLGAGAAADGDDARVSGRTVRASAAGAGMAPTGVLSGALTAKVADAAVACQGFPLCGAGSIPGAAEHVQLTHRIIAYLVAFHLVFFAARLRGRRESPVVTRAALAAAGGVLLQITLGAVMVLTHLTIPAIRSLHQANGILLWVLAFASAYLARRAIRATRAAGPVVEREAAAAPALAGVEA